MAVSKRLLEEEYRFIYSRTPRLCVDLAIPIANGLILTQRAIEPFKDTWHLPGGRVLYKESIAKAVKRICTSELGVEAKDSRLIGFLEVLNDVEYVHSVSMVFLLSISSDKFVGDFQSKKIKAFSSLPKNTMPSHKDFLTLHWQEIVSIPNEFG